MTLTMFEIMAEAIPLLKMDATVRPQLWKLSINLEERSREEETITCILESNREAA